jgi:hypothetical protein
MKVYIPKPAPWYSTRKMEEAYYFRRYGLDKYGCPNEPLDKDKDRLDQCMELFFEFCQSYPIHWINIILNRFPSRESRIRIDRWDVWSMDFTLAEIVVPMLKLLKKQTHGAPCVEDEDVPEEYRSTSATPLTEDEQRNGHTDELWFKRWDWVLDEMIFAFESKNDNWEDQFYSGERDLIYAQQEDGFVKIEHGPNHTFEIDNVGREEYQKRITNGFRLFGKYYENLWT